MTRKYHISFELTTNPDVMLPVAKKFSNHGSPIRWLRSAIRDMNMNWDSEYRIRKVEIKEVK